MHPLPLCTIRERARFPVIPLDACHKSYIVTASETAGIRAGNQLSLFLLRDTVMPRRVVDGFASSFPRRQQLSLRQRAAISAAVSCGKARRNAGYSIPTSKTDGIALSIVANSTLPAAPIAIGNG